MPPVRSFVVLLSLLILTPFTFAQEQKDGRYYEAAARKAYQDKNYLAFLTNMKLASDLRPNHPRLMYNLAIAYSLNGQPTEALALLRKTAEMGLIFPTATEHDLDSLHNLTEFDLIVKQFEKNKSPKVNSITAFTVHEKGLVPESVAYDEDTHVFYLSSVYKRKILAVSRAGDVKDFSAEADGLWSVMGMKVDRARHLLWVCTTAHQQMSGFLAEDKGKTALFKYNLKTRKLVAKYQPTDHSKPHWFGDLAINAQGDVFTTDSVTPAVYVVRHNSDKLETFIEGEPFVSPQGLDFTPNQQQMFVADYSKGVFLVDLNTKKVSSIVSDFTLLGIDGLYYYRDSLIAVQNGVNPQRVVKISLNKDRSRFERFEIIEANNPVFDEPTLGVLVKNDFYFIANSQWGAIDDSGHLAPTEKLKDPTILKVKL